MQESDKQDKNLGKYQGKTNPDGSMEKTATKLESRSKHAQKPRKGAMNSDRNEDHRKASSRSNSETVDQVSSDMADSELFDNNCGAQRNTGQSLIRGFGLNSPAFLDLDFK